MSLPFKIFMPLTGFAFLAAGGLIAVFSREESAMPLAWLFIGVGAFVFVFSLLCVFRWKVDIAGTQIIYVPLIGKTKNYSIGSVRSVYINVSYHYRGAKHKEIYLQMETQTIRIPYRAAGARLLLQAWEHKVQFDEDA
ncbi:MAG: hypothetical protein M0R40_11615 [Firmicutes bacterium]|nr:hypothetical protein [Bacillota bacterium]